MTEPEPTVFIVDDDPAVLKGLRLLMKSVRMNVEPYLGAEEFLDSYNPARSGCLLVDVRMPGMSGLELQEKLREKKISIPVIMITGYSDVPVAVKAMKNGALDFLEKPFSGQVILERVRDAVAEDARTRHKQAEQEAVAARLATLTPRECQVMDLVIDGKSNKVIALELGISQKTVEFHRSNVMKKMQVDSLAQLVRLLTRIGTIS